MYHYFTTSCPRTLLLHIVAIDRLAEMTETQIPLSSLELVLPLFWQVLMKLSESFLEAHICCESSYVWKYETVRIIK